MSYSVVQLPTLTAASTGTNVATIAIGGLDDAEVITFFMISTAAAASSGTGLALQVSQFDPSILSSASPTGVIVSTAYHTLSSLIFSSGAGLITSSGVAIQITDIGFKGLRITGLTSATNGEKIAFVSKQILI